MCMSGKVAEFNKNSTLCNTVDPGTVKCCTNTDLHRLQTQRLYAKKGGDDVALKKTTFSGEQDSVFWIVVWRREKSAGVKKGSIHSSLFCFVFFLSKGPRSDK